MHFSSLQVFHLPECMVELELYSLFLCMNSSILRIRIIVIVVVFSARQVSLLGHLFPTPGRKTRNGTSMLVFAGAKVATIVGSGFPLTKKITYNIIQSFLSLGGM